MYSKANIFFSIVFVSLSGLTSVSAESEVEALSDITVTATRVDKSLYEVPAAVGVVGKDDLQLGTQQLGLDEALNKLPGLFITNRYNFSQDLRISIRGYGSRATFGIRGVKVYVDGIPNTLPDGQGSVDSIDIGSTDRIEVIRGPTSSIYGTASGGVLNLFTEDGLATGHEVEGRATAGSHGLTRFQLKAGGQKDKLNYLFNFSRLDYEGYREHSETDNFLINSKFRYDIDSRSDLTLTVNAVHSPEANDPGGLCSTFSATPFCTTLGNASRKEAQRNNLRFDAGEAVSQQQVGLLYKRTFGSNDNHELIARNYYVHRDFDANLPFGYFGGPLTPSGGIVALDRFFVGGGLQYSVSENLFGRRNRLLVGFDIDSQMDDRANFTNIVDSPVVGPLSLNQDEDVFNWGIYVQNEFAITDKLELTTGIRYDEVEFDFNDKFLADGNQSGTATFEEWSPQAGLLWKVRDGINLYGNVSTSFETPSTREFASPTGPGGFNTGLDAQTSTNYEIGVKGILNGIASYQLSFFKIDTEDELLPAGENLAGSVFFRNAGETERLGIEAGLTLRPMNGLDVTFNYTYSDFEFESLVVSGQNFAGEKIPGVPQQIGYIEVAYYNPSGFYGIFDMQYVDEVFVNNAYLDFNDDLITQGEAADDYLLANLRFGYTGLSDSEIEITPFIGLNNIFNQKYIGNVRVNESRHRYFDPAPEFNLFGGISMVF